MHDGRRWFFLSDEAWAWIDREGDTFAEVFRAGLRMRFASANDGHGGGGARGTITNQSQASRMRCAFALGQAECTWAATSLLTFPEVPTDGYVEAAWRAMRRAWRGRWCESIDAWVMEIQARGAPHFHLFHAAESNFGLSCSVAHRQTVGSGKREREILRGGVDWWLREAWLKAIKRTKCEAAQAFCAGGMIEPLRSADAAGRYVSAEASKPHQKRLPEIYEDGLGRWWWLAPRWRPRRRAVVGIDLDEWPFETPMKHVFDGEQIAHCIRGEAPSP